MSEENPQTPTPEDKSSSVPLKKETTRVTLKASEGAAPPPPAPAASTHMLCICDTPRHVRTQRAQRAKQNQENVRNVPSRIKLRTRARDRECTASTTVPAGPGPRR